MKLDKEQLIKVLHEQLVEGKADPDEEGFSFDMMSDWDKALDNCAQAIIDALGQNDVS